MMSPCKDCPDRTAPSIPCWDTCDRYKRFKETLQKSSEHQRQQGVANIVVNDGARRRKGYSNKGWRHNG